MEDRFLGQECDQWNRRKDFQAVITVLFTTDSLIFRQINMSLLIHLYKHQPSVPLENLFFFWFGILGYILLVEGRYVVSLPDFICSVWLYFSYFHEKRLLFPFHQSWMVHWIRNKDIKTLLDVLLISVVLSNSCHFSVHDSPLSSFSLSLLFGWV